MTSAEYMQTLGATDVPRNAAAVVYLMTTGFMFFLFFAWAWIFAQPVLRDRSVSLHEIVLTAPISLKLLMCGRYFGACLLGIFLGCAVLCGFFVAPLLEVAGWLPPGSFAATPWSQFGFALVWLIIPTTMGVGALYLIAAIVSRSIVGPLCASVFIILVWMFCAVTLTEGDVNVTLAGVLDPSLFSFTLAETDLWTPDQKASAFLPLQWDFLANRFVWAGLPVIAFAIVLSRLDRERLISSIETTGAPNKADHRDAETVIQGVISSEEPARSWMRVYLRECGWQVSQVFQSRAFWIGAIILLCVGLSNAFIHIIWHADGPLLPDPNLMVREVNTSLYLVVVFILAALVGLVSRRDSVAGMDEMLDGLSTPDSLRLTARAVAVFLAVVVLTLVPGLAVVIATLLAGPSFLSPAFVFQAQMLVVAPAQIEAAMIIFLIHALIRHTGLAYGVSMFVVLVLILNHELGLTSYPPFEVGVPARMAFSPLTGWVPWLNYVATLGIYKITFGLFLVGAAALVLPRGFNSRLQHGGETIRERVRMRPGLIMLVVVVGLSSSFWVLTKQLVENGGYKSADASRAEDAAWERQWSQDLGDLAFSIQGGELHVSVNTSTPEVVGHWELKRVVASSEFLYATAPAGLVDIQARVNGRSTPIRIEHDLIRLHLGACGAQGCDVVLDWTVRQQGWPSAAEAP
ncbi:MAG: ABC transporter permease, partial [Pseudomonadota bacterium]